MGKPAYRCPGAQTVSACLWVTIMKTVTTSSYSTPDWGAFAAFLARRSSLRAAFTLCRQSPDTGCAPCNTLGHNATQMPPRTSLCGIQSIDTLPAGPAARWGQVAVRSHLAVCAGLSRRHLQDYRVPGSRITSTIGLPGAMRN